MIKRDCFYSVLGMIHRLESTVWTSMSFLSDLVTVWHVAEDARLVLESNIEWQKMMPWNGSRWNTKESFSTSLRTLLVKKMRQTNIYNMFFSLARIVFSQFCFASLIFRHLNFLYRYCLSTIIVQFFNLLKFLIKFSKKNQFNRLYLCKIKDNIILTGLELYV